MSPVRLLDSTAGCIAATVIATALAMGIAWALFNFPVRSPPAPTAAPVHLVGAATFPGKEG